MFNTDNDNLWEEEEGFCKVDMNKAYAFGHKMCVVTYNRKVVRFDELGGPNYDDEPYVIKHEGVYMFGGLIGLE